jgi:hypothetical protein
VIVRHQPSGAGEIDSLKKLHTVLIDTREEYDDALADTDAYVLDLSPDFAYFPNGWEEQYEIARRGAFPALTKMREEGILQAWGVGVNTPYAIMKVIEDADPDVCLCATTD